MAKKQETISESSLSSVRVQEVVQRYLTQAFLHDERGLSRKEAQALAAFVAYVVSICPDNPDSSHYMPGSRSAARAEAEKVFRRRVWEHLVQPRHVRLLDHTVTDALAAAYIRLSADVPWKHPSRQIFFVALNLLAAAATEGPSEILDSMKFWSELKGDEKPHTRYQKKEALRIRENYLNATYGWSSIERVDPNFTGGSVTSWWLWLILIFLILVNVGIFLWGNGYIHV